MRVTRRAALLGVGAVSGCTFTPVNFSTETAAPSASVSVDPTVTVDPDFFARATDGSPKLLPEGAASGQRFSTPHLDGVLAELFVGRELARATTRQTGEDTPLRAPQGHELAAFTLLGGRPTYIVEAGHEPVVQLRVGDSLIPVPNLFNEFSTAADTYLTPWEMIILCVPAGSEVSLEVTDEDRAIAVDLRSGAPRVDDAWEATTGFRERWEVLCEPESGVFSRDFTTLPPAGMEADTGRLNVGLRPDTGGGFRPWTPTQGWAPQGTQWLSVNMGARIQWEARLVPELTLSVPQSFSHGDDSGQQGPAVHPESISTDALITGQAELLVVWPVVVAAGNSTISFNAAGAMSVDYDDVQGVAAEFTGAATPLEFVLTATPSQR